MLISQLDNVIDLAYWFFDKAADENCNIDNTKTQCLIFLAQIKYAELHEKIPLAVLVDGMTASSAEIVSGALQDLDRAVIIGMRTYGKGLVQVPREVPYHGSLKVTTSRYYIPSGRCIQAYDYRHLNADGSVGTVPDSLTKVFYTAGGREVRDGGGIKPDIVMQPDSLPALVYDVAASDVALEYVCNYVAAHPEIAPAGEFVLSDKDYEDFVNLVAKSDFTYKRRTEEVLKLLKKAAQFEGCYDEAKEEFEALEQKMSGNVTADLMRFKKDISEILENDIVSRYYFQKGAIKQQLRDDKFVEKALEVFSDGDYYHSILSVSRNEKK